MGIRKVPAAILSAQTHPVAILSARGLLVAILSIPNQPVTILKHAHHFVRPASSDRLWDVQKARLVLNSARAEAGAQNALPAQGPEPQGQPASQTPPSVPQPLETASGSDHKAQGKSHKVSKEEKAKKPSKAIAKTKHLGSGDQAHSSMS